MSRTEAKLLSKRSFRIHKTIKVGENFNTIQLSNCPVPQLLSSSSLNLLQETLRRNITIIHVILHGSPLPERSRNVLERHSNCSGKMLYGRENWIWLDNHSAYGSCLSTHILQIA